MTTRASRFGPGAAVSRSASFSAATWSIMRWIMRLQQRILGRKVIKKPALAEPGSLGNGFERQPSGADFGHKLCRRIEDLFPGTLAASGIGKQHLHLLSCAQAHLQLNRPDGI